MPRTCSVCDLDDLTAVDEAIVGGTPYREIARRHGVSVAAVGRHKADHLSPALIAAVRDRDRARATSLTGRLEGLADRVERMLESAEESGKVSQALAAVRELRSTLELIARLTGELDERAQVQVVNVQTHPGWVALQTVVMAALMRFPKARAEVVAAIARSLPELEAAESRS